MQVSALAFSHTRWQRAIWADTQRVPSVLKVFSDICLRSIEHSSASFQCVLSQMLLSDSRYDCPQAMQALKEALKARHSPSAWSSLVLAQMRICDWSSRQWVLSSLFPFFDIGRWTNLSSSFEHIFACKLPDFTWYLSLYPDLPADLSVRNTLHIVPSSRNIC